MVAYMGSETYLRVARAFVGPELGADGGTDDIRCHVANSRTDKQVAQTLGAEFEGIMRGLTKDDTRYYVKGELIGDAYYDVVAVNRYTKSAFLDGYENSTIRIRVIASAQSESTITVATSIYVSKTEATTPQGYTGASPAQTSAVVQKLAQLMPAHFNCKIQNP
jgi:hypothetical protein